MTPFYDQQLKFTDGLGAKIKAFRKVIISEKITFQRFIDFSA